MTRLQVLVVWAALAVARMHMHTHAHAHALASHARAHTDHRLRSPRLPADAAPRVAPQRSTLDSEEEIDDSNVDTANTTRRVSATRGHGETHNAAEDVTARPRADLPAISRTPRRSTRDRTRTDDPQPREPSSPPASWDRSTRSRRRHQQRDRDNLITNSQRSPETRKRSKKRGKKKTRPVSGDKRINGSTTHSENQGLSSRVIDGGKTSDESEESNTRVHTLRGDSLRRSRSRNRGVKKFEEELGHATIKDDERRSVAKQISSPAVEDQVNSDRVSAATIHKLQDDVQPVGSSRVADLAQEANHDVYVPRLRKNNEDGGIKLLEIVERELAKIDPNDTIKYQVNEKPNLASDKERNGDNSQTYFHMRGRNSNREHPEEVAFDSVDTKNGDVSSNTRDRSKLFQAEQLEEQGEEPEFDYYSECLDMSGITCNNNQDTGRKLEYDDGRRNDKKYDHTSTRKSDETDYYTFGNSPATSNEDKELLDETQKPVKGVQTDELASSQRDEGTKERIVSIPNMHEDIREGSPFYEYSYSRPKVNPYLYTSNKDYERYWHALSPKDPTGRSREEVLKSREPGNERETTLVEPKGDNSSDRVPEPPRNERLEETQDELTNVRSNAKTHENAYSKMIDEPHTHRYSQDKDDKILSEDMEEDSREVIKKDSSDREEEPITERLSDLKEPINTEHNGKILYEPKPSNREHEIDEEQEKPGNVGRESTKEEKEINVKLPAEEDKEISQKQNERPSKIENSFYPYSKRTEPRHYMYDDEEDGYPFYENTYRVPIAKLRERMNENDESRSRSKLSFKEDDVDNEKYSGQEEEKAKTQQTSSESEEKYPHLEHHEPSQIFHGEDGKRNRSATIYEELNDKGDDETLHSDSSGSSKDTAPIVYKNEEKEERRDQYLSREGDENNSEQFSQSQEPSKNMDDEKETVPNYGDVSNNHKQMRFNKNIDSTNVEPERYIVHHSYRPSEDEMLNLPVSGDSEETKVEPKPKQQQEKAVNREDIKHVSYSEHLEGHRDLQSAKEEISHESAPRTNGRYSKSRSPKQLLNSRYQSAEPIQDADKDDKEIGPYHPTETMESETLHYTGGNQRTRSGIRSARPERSRNIQRKQNESSESQHLQRQRNSTRRKIKMNPPERTTFRSHTDSESDDYTEEIDNVANENTDHLLNSQTPESQERQPERSDITEVLPQRKPINRIRTSRNHNRARFEEQQDQRSSSDRAKALVGARPTRASRGGYHRSQRDDWASEPRDYQQLDEELWEATEVQELVPEMDEWLAWESQRIAPRQREEYQPAAAETEQIVQQPLREHRPRTALLRGSTARSASLEEQPQINQPRRGRPAGKGGSVSTANRDQRFQHEKERLGAQEINYVGPRVPKADTRNIRLHALKLSEENNRVRGEEKDRGQEKDNDVEEDEETDEEEWEDEGDEGEDEEEEEEDDRERLRSRI